MRILSKRNGLSGRKGDGPPPPALLAGGLALLLVLTLRAGPAPAVSTEVSGSSRTYLRARETAGGDFLLPLYEYLTLSADGVGREDLAFRASGWFRFDLAEESPQNGESTNGDLQYAYLSYRRESSDLVVNVGRTPVFEGLASELVDGAYGRVRLERNIGVAAYLGVPVEADHDGSGGDFLVGGRASHTRPGKYVVGASYLYETNDGSEFRQEIGWDLWTRPWKPFSLQGRSSYSLRTSGWMEHDYSAELGPFRSARIFLNLQYVSFRDFFTGHSNSAFDFTATGLDEDETMLSVGGTVEYPVLDNLPVFIEYRNYSYDIAGGADYYGGGCRWYRSDEDGAGAEIHRMDGETDLLRYIRFRAYGYKRFGKYDLSLDFVDTKFDETRGGEDNTLVASVAAGRELWEKARVAADFDIASGLDVDSEIRVLVKFLYGFDKSLGGGGGE